MSAIETSGEPIEEMLAYHGVVRRQLEHMRAIEAALRGAEPQALERARALADEVVKRLGLERILHERDEVESLLPRLQDRVDGAAEPELVEQLAQLAAEHRAWEAAWRPIQFWLWMVSVDDPIVTADEVADACRTAEEQLLAHAEEEERILYPAARRLLDEADLAAIAEERAARRRRFGPPS